MKHWQASSPWRLAHILCLALLLLVLTGCATGPKMAWHAFSFDGWYDNWADQNDLLEYDYGGQYNRVRKKAEPSEETLGYRSSVNGVIPVGDFLYVKWRIKATGEVREDRVDLRPLLPKNMDDYGLTFVIDGRQLYIYLVTPQARDHTKPQPLKTFLSVLHEAYEIYPSNTFPNTRQTRPEAPDP